MKKHGILLAFFVMVCLLAVSIPAVAVQGIIVGPEGLPPEERKEEKRPADRSFRPHAVLEYRCGRHNWVWLPEMTA